MSQTKVLLLLHELSLTGSPQGVLNIFEALKGQVSLRVIVPKGGPLEGRCDRLGRLYVLDRHERRRPLVRSGPEATRRRVAASVGRWRPDVVYVNSLAGLRLAQLVALPDAPALLHVHELGTSFDLFADLTDELTHWPRRYVAVSEPVRDVLTGRYGIAAEAVRIVPPFVRDLDYLRPLPPPRAGGTFVVGGAGLPQWRKGTTLWLQMAAALRRLLPDRELRFVWVGVHEGYYETLCFQEEARKLGLADVVELVPVTHEPLRQFGRFDAFAMTSWEDPCPAVVLENMMLGKPVVCFAGGGGAPGQVGDPGLVVADFDPAAMARVLADLARDPERRRQVGGAARERIGGHYLSAKIAPQILGEIEALAKTGPRPGKGRR